MAKKEETSVEEEMEDGTAEMRVYELGFHLDPELPTEEVKKAYQDMRAAAKEAGDIVAEGEPQSLQLAYTISRMDTTGRRDFSSAYFAWIAYEATVEAHAAVVAKASADKRVIRFIDLVTTKDAARHAAELREIAARANEAVEEAEVQVDAELDAALQGAAA